MRKVGPHDHRQDMVWPLLLSFLMIQEPRGVVLEALGSPLLETTGLIGKAHLLLDEQEEQLGEGMETRVSQRNRSFAVASERVKNVPNKTYVYPHPQ